MNQQCCSLCMQNMLRFAATIWKCPDFLPEIRYPRYQDTVFCNSELLGQIFSTIFHPLNNHFAPMFPLMRLESRNFWTFCELVMFLRDQQKTKRKQICLFLPGYQSKKYWITFILENVNLPSFCLMLDLNSLLFSCRKI